MPSLPPSTAGAGRPDPDRGDPLLRIHRVSRRFGAVTALSEVSLAIWPGEVVALLGDNGAGKSTLVKIISGAQEPSEGEIWFDGRRVAFDSPADAKAAGIETVYQDLSLCMNVDVVANFFMGRELVRRVLGFRILREREMQAVTEQALRDIGSRVPDVRLKAEHLSGGQRQAIELCRFVHWGGKLVILDEPFAALGIEQTRRGLALIDRVRRQGVAVLVITHNIFHAFQVADRVIVLHQGTVAADRPIAETSREEVMELISGDARHRDRLSA